jgi:hypothetical protein
MTSSFFSTTRPAGWSGSALVISDGAAVPTAGHGWNEEHILHSSMMARERMFPFRPFLIYKNIADKIKKELKKSVRLIELAGPERL